MRLSTTIAILALLAAGCIQQEAAAQRPAPANLKYVCIRPVSSEPSGKRTTAATIYGKIVYYDREERILDAGGLKSVHALTNPLGGYSIGALLTPEGAKSLGAWTASHIGEQVGIFVADRLVMAPIVRSRIDDAVTIDGNFTKEEAEQIANRIRAGGAP